MFEPNHKFNPMDCWITYGLVDPLPIFSDFRKRRPDLFAQGTPTEFPPKVQVDAAIHQMKDYIEEYALYTPDKRGRDRMDLPVVDFVPGFRNRPPREVHRGDCEDYSAAQKEVAIASGLSVDLLRYLLAIDRTRGTYHCLLCVIQDRSTSWLVDNWASRGLNQRYEVLAVEQPGERWGWCQRPNAIMRALMRVDVDGRRFGIG